MLAGFNFIIIVGLFAQTQKSNWLVGGSALFNSQEVEGFNTTTFLVNPGAGYFIMDDLAIGANIQFSSIKEEGYDAFTTLAFGPFVRYYFVNLGPKTKLFGNGSFGFGNVKYGDSESFTTWELSAGPAIFLNKHVALEIALGYSSQKFQDTDATNAFGFRVGFQIHLGGGKSQ